MPAILPISSMLTLTTYVLRTRNTTSCPSRNHKGVCASGHDWDLGPTQILVPRSRNARHFLWFWTIVDVTPKSPKPYPSLPVLHDWHTNCGHTLKLSPPFSGNSPAPASLNGAPGACSLNCSVTTTTCWLWKQALDGSYHRTRFSSSLALQNGGSPDSNPPKALSTTANEPRLAAMDGPHR